MSEDQKKFIEQFFRRTKELEKSGLDWFHASGIADIEQKINNWPEKWGNDFVALIYGDFEPLTEKLTIENLGITISPEVLKNTVVKNERTVHRATVSIHDKSIDSIVDAVRRINIFIGTFTLLTWCNSYCNWWSHITHNSSSGGVKTTLSQEGQKRAIDGVIFMKPEIRKKVDYALYWLREPKNSMFNWHRLDLMRYYAAYWNAFECLVDAVNIAVPKPKKTKFEKQELLDMLFEDNDKNVSPKFIQDAYINIVNPGLKQKAEQALKTCFGDLANHYIDECFNLENKNNRLYNIRNAINHGEIDAENPEEQARIQSRLSKLRIMILGMFGRIVPYSYPVDRINDSGAD